MKGKEIETKIKVRLAGGQGGVQGAQVSGAVLSRKQKQSENLRKDLITSIQENFRHFNIQKTKKDFNDSYTILDSKCNLASLEAQLKSSPTVYLKIADDIALVNFLFATCKFGNKEQIKNVFDLFNTTKDDPSIQIMKDLHSTSQHQSPSLTKLNLCCPYTQAFLPMVNLNLSIIDSNSFLGSKDSNYTLFHALAENEMIDLDQESLASMGIGFLSELKDKEITFLGQKVTPVSYRTVLRITKIYNRQREINQEKLRTSQEQLSLLQGNNVELTELQGRNVELKESNERLQQLNEALKQSLEETKQRLETLQTRKVGVEKSTQTDQKETTYESKGTSTDLKEELMEEVWARNDRLDEKVYELTQGKKVLSKKLEESIQTIKSLEEELKQEKQKGSWS